MAATPKSSLDQELIKTALAALDWTTLKAHFDGIGLTRDQLTEVCGHAQRCTYLIYKYPRPKAEADRARLFDELRAEAVARFGETAQAHRLDDGGARQNIPVIAGGVVAAAVGMMDETRSRAPPPPA